MKALQCKFKEFILLPANAIDTKENEFRTTDGVDVSVKFISTWNNKDGQYDEQLDELCIREYGTPFVTIRSIWIGRLGRADEYWHLIKLTRV